MIFSSHKDRVLGICTLCQRKLLINPENGWCLTCENDALREENAKLILGMEKIHKENLMYKKENIMHKRKIESLLEK